MLAADLECHTAQSVCLRLGTAHVLRGIGHRRRLMHVLDCVYKEKTQWAVSNNQTQEAFANRKGNIKHVRKEAGRICRINRPKGRLARRVSYRNSVHLALICACKLCERPENRNPQVLSTFYILFSTYITLGRH